MTTTNEHTERPELIKGLRDLAEIDFDNLFMRAAAMLEAQPAAIKPWQIMPTVKDRATNRELPVVGVYEDVVFVDVPAADDKAVGEPVTGRDLFVAWWDGYGMQPGVECSLPVWKYQETAIQSAWNHVAMRYYTHPQPQAEVPDENRCIRELREYAEKNQGTYIFPGWDGNRVTKYLSAAQKPQDDLPAILKKQAS